MSWFKKAWRKTMDAAKAAGSAIMTLAVAPERLSSTKEFLEAGLMKVWASWKCCDLIASEITATSWEIVNDKTGDQVEVKDLKALLESPNPDNTFGDMLIPTVHYLKMIGMAFWYKDEATLSGDRPRALRILYPHQMTIYLNQQRDIRGYGYRIGGVEVPFDPEEVIYFRRPDPLALHKGRGDLHAGAYPAQNAINMANYQAKFWTNGATPSTVMILEDPGQTDLNEWEKLKRKFANEYGGTDNAGKTAFLSGKWKSERIGLTASEIQAIETEKWSVEQICHIHGVPLSVIGIRDAANYATAQIDDVRFRRYTVRPIIKLIEDTLNLDLVAGFRQGIKLKWDMKGLINVEHVAQSYAPIFDRGGMTVNELREAVGLKPDPENPEWEQTYMDARYVPTMLAGTTDQSGTQEINRMLDRTSQRLLENHRGWTETELARQ